jgi:RNA polymerase sigma-70 factor (ECF subfamily)
VEPADSDEMLLSRWEAGDVSAFEVLFRRHRSAAYRVAWRLLGHEADALDAVQDGFIKVLTQWRQFRGQSSFRTWLLRVVSRSALDIGRERQRLKRYDAVAFAAARSPSAIPSQQRLECDDLRQRLQWALHHLPDAQRQTVVLYVDGGLTYREIAEATGVSIGTVMSRLFHARQKLRMLLASRVTDP